MNAEIDTLPQAIKISKNFSRNIQALVVFAGVIGDFADRHDLKITQSINSEINEVASILAEIVPDSFTEIEENQDSEEEEKGSGANLSEEQKYEVAKKVRKVVVEHRQKILSISQKIYKTPPIQGDLLRRNTLISLMSSLETLISQLIREFYQKYPEALPSESKSLSLTELRSLGSVEEAEAHLIDNEIDSILRGNIQSQLAYFEKPIKISLKQIEKYTDQLIEVSQRRNLLVHNDGVINRYYLNKVPVNLIEKDAKEGDRIPVVSSYLMSRIQMIHLVGTILIQQCFRKWEKDNIEALNDLLIDLLFDSLVERNYNFTEKLADYAYSIDIKNDKDLRIIVTNHCIALREQKKLEEMEKILSKYDWSAVSLEFELALAALRSEEDEVYKILDKAISIKSIDLPKLNEWPLFDNFRNSERFKDYLKENFPEFSDVEGISNLDKGAELDEGVELEKVEG